MEITIRYEWLNWYLNFASVFQFIPKPETCEEWQLNSMQTWRFKLNLISSLTFWRFVNLIRWTAPLSPPVTKNDSSVFFELEAILLIPHFWIWYLLDFGNLWVAQLCGTSAVVR